MSDFLTLVGLAARNADTGNHQRSETNEGQKVTHLPHKPVCAGRRAVAVAEVEAGIGERLGQRLFGLFEIGGLIVESDAVFALVKRSGLQKSGGSGNVARNQNGGAKLETFGQAVRLVCDHPCCA